MISLYSGTPGSGKSLHVARDIVNWLKKGRTVIGNIAINPETKGYEHYIYKWDNELTVQFFIEFSAKYFSGRNVKEDEILVVIDEAQMMFNTREWQRKDRNKWLQFLQLHRHYGFKFVLVSQFAEMLDKQIRGLIEYDYQHCKLLHLGWAGLLVSVCNGMAGFRCQQYFFGKKKLVSTTMFRYTKKIGNVYNTFEIL